MFVMRLLVKLTMFYVFGKLDSAIKMRLLVNYCYSLYGCCLWNITNPAVEYVYMHGMAGWRSAGLWSARHHPLRSPSVNNFSSSHHG